MRGSVMTTLLLTVLGCSIDNPGFGLKGGTANNGGTDAATLTDQPVTGTVDSTASTSLTTSSTSDGTGSAACPDVIPEEGTPCDAEDLMCSDICDEPCAVCNIGRCEQGTWKLEVVPSNCLDCESVCPFLLMSACANGPPDQAFCVTSCEGAMSACGPEHDQLRACIGGMPTFICDAVGNPTVAGCEAESDNLIMCLEGESTGG